MLYLGFFQTFMMEPFAIISKSFYLLSAFVENLHNRWLRGGLEYASEVAMQIIWLSRIQENSISAMHFMPFEDWD